MTAIDFANIGRLPAPDDNAAIAIRTIEPNTTVQFGESVLKFTQTILPGHRFAVSPIAVGEHLLSWGQPFGVAITPIQAGDYVCNAHVLRELGGRALGFSLPEQPNFADALAPFQFDADRFQAAEALTRYDSTLTFKGYPRTAKRGVGTRNTIVLLGTSSLTGGFVRMLEARLKSLAAKYPHIDGIVAAAHTEGGHAHPNNRDLLLRTLAGFIVNPNVGAVLAVDYGQESVNNNHLRAYLAEHDYPIDDVPHTFFSLTESLEASLEAATQIVTQWLDMVNQTSRIDVPVSALKIGLQCGGSDAFSGISANPLCGWVTKEVLHHGGTANIAETDELIGAETYMLAKVREAATGERFVATLARFREWAGWHGQSAEGNPSGGNLYRGLYNIYLKSLGAAIKKHPQTRLDYVIEYGEPMYEAGFYFMDSPGNDLESVAGQVAAGCNLIFFTTGNGSITNFPFVPTIKMVTTTERYQLLSAEMDVNAGQYLDGMAMDELGSQTFQLTLDIASGQRSVGERAGHAQVQIWRDWQQTAPVDLQTMQTPRYTGVPLTISAQVDVPDVHFSRIRTRRGTASEQVGLILPTSLCSGQIARMCAEQLNAQNGGRAQGITRFVTLVHTEGCGASSVGELTDTLLGYLVHPMVNSALLLEHGCEKTHNSYVRHAMLERDLDPRAYGWASVQLDGGIQNVTAKMSDWFDDQLQTQPPLENAEAGLEAVRLGLVTQAEQLSEALATEFATLTAQIVLGGGTVILTEHDPLLRDKTFLLHLGLSTPSRPTLNYAQPCTRAGLHVMAIPSRYWGETLTGLGATGVEVILAYQAERPLSGHPLVPVLQVTSTSAPAARYGADLDDIFDHDTDIAGSLLRRVVSTLSGDYHPRSNAIGNTDFQIPRGLLTVSL